MSRQSGHRFAGKDMRRTLTAGVRPDSNGTGRALAKPDGGSELDLRCTSSSRRSLFKPFVLVARQAAAGPVTENHRMRIRPIGLWRAKYTLLGLSIPHWIILITVIVLLRG